LKAYPSIPREIRRDIPVYVYDKLDGSNIRAEWSKSQGFYKFGSRKRLLGSDDKMLGEAIGLVKANHSHLHEIFSERRYQGAVAYFEFFGSSSFAGQHKDEPHECLLIDVEIRANGFLTPPEFEALDVPRAPLLYSGAFTEDLEKQVRDGSLPGMTFEGVVCKGETRKKWSLPVTFKVKSDAWIAKVKELYNDPRILEDLL
jgi:hypothetical protein